MVSNSSAMASEFSCLMFLANLFSGTVLLMQSTWSSIFMLYLTFVKFDARKFIAVIRAYPDETTCVTRNFGCCPGAWWSLRWVYIRWSCRIAAVTATSYNNYGWNTCAVLSLELRLSCGHGWCSLFVNELSTRAVFAVTTDVHRLDHSPWR